MIVLYSALPLVIKRPELSFVRSPLPPGWVAGQGLKINLRLARVEITNWYQSFASFTVIFVLFAVGFLSLPPDRKRPFLAMGILLGGLVAVSVLYVEPTYPAMVFYRDVIPLFILLTGLFGQAIWAWLTTALRWIELIVQDGVARTRSATLILSFRGWVLVLLLLLAGAVTARIPLTLIRNGLSGVRDRVQRGITRQHIALDAAQVERLLSYPGGCGSVAYTDEKMLYFYLTHGALQCGAVYTPAVVGTSVEQPWLTANDDIHYLAAMNPITGLNIAQEGGIVLQEGTRLDFQFDGTVSASMLSIYVDNPQGDARLVFRSADGDAELAQIDVPAQSSGWLQAAF